MKTSTIAFQSTFLLFYVEHNLGFQPITIGHTNQCKRGNGLPKGICASGFGVCCVFIRSCDDTISKNNTYFRSIGFPDSIQPNSYQFCRTKIIRPSEDICQILLLFHDMDLNKGDNNGRCLVDSIKIFGVTSDNTPHLCGPLSKQHLYLEFAKRNPITLDISTDGSQINNRRKWNLQIVYMRCNDPLRAPSGCSQYYTNSSGVVKILGYPENPHLAGLQYTICVRQAAGAKSIFWFPCRSEPVWKSFHMQGPNFLMTGFNLVWFSCFGDYITIMSDKTSTVRENHPKDRYCGNRLTNMPPFFINTKITPYIVHVRTDLFEGEEELENQGFCLEWLQVIWEAAPGMPIEIMPPEEGP